MGEILQQLTLPSFAGQRDARGGVVPSVTPGWRESAVDMPLCSDNADAVSTYPQPPQQRRQHDINNTHNGTCSTVTSGSSGPHRGGHFSFPGRLR